MCLPSAIKNATDIRRVMKEQVGKVMASVVMQI